MSYDKYNDPTPVKLVPGKSDQDIANELKTEMIEASKATCAVLNKALELGFQMNVQYGPDLFGKMTVVQLVVSKVFK